VPEPRRILILGGYGSTGRCLSRLLIAHTTVVITVAGRDASRAQTLCHDLASPRAAPLQVDARDPAALRTAIAGHHLVLLAAPGADLPALVAEAALDGGADYLDVVYPPSKLPALNALALRIDAAGLCFVTEAGFHPGLPSLLVRWAAGQCDVLETADVASLIRMRIPSGRAVPDSAVELIDNLTASPMSEFHDGAWQEIGWTRWPYRPFDFGPGLGTLQCVPLYFDELRAALAPHPELHSTRFLMAGFGAFTDWVAMPLIFVLQAVARQATRKFCADLLWWSIQHFTSPPFGTILAVRYTGLRDGRAVSGCLRLRHEDEYPFTAIPVVAFLLQWLYGVIPPDLHYMGMAADPARLLADMGALGIVEDYPG